MSEIQKLTQALVQFRDERDWSQFHNAKDLALALSIEAAELNELFLWKDKEEIKTVRREDIKEEVADIFAYALLLAHKFNFDVSEIINEKIAKNALKYPIEKSKGKSTKYDQL